MHFVQKIGLSSFVWVQCEGRATGVSGQMLAQERRYAQEECIKSAIWSMTIILAVHYIYQTTYLSDPWGCLVALKDKRLC